MAVVQQRRIVGMNYSNSAYFVRALEREDIGQLESLLSQLSNVGDVNPDAENEFFDAVSASNSHIVYVISDHGGKIYGAATLLIERKLLHGGSSVGHIEDVVVSKELRGKGFGKLLITALIHASYQQGCYKVILDCSDENVTFYERCGLKKCGNEMGVYF